MFASWVTCLIILVVEVQPLVIIVGALTVLQVVEVQPVVIIVGALTVEAIVIIILVNRLVLPSKQY